MDKRDPRRINDIVKDVVDGIKGYDQFVHVIDELPAPPVPATFVHLQNLRTDHFEGKNSVDRFLYVVSKAHVWIKESRRIPGLSFVLAGGIGTGKTTIAQNLLSSWTEVFHVGLEYDADDYRELMTLAAEAVDNPDLRRLLVEQEDVYFDMTIAAPQGAIYEATDLMAILENGDMMERFLGRHRVIVVDDLGEEEIPYTNATSLIEKRQLRYGRFFDYCERTKKSVVVTSMKALLVRDSSGDSAFNPELVDIVGSRAFSRLYHIAQGYMCDLSGLPDFRMTGGG